MRRKLLLQLLTGKPALSQGEKPMSAYTKCAYLPCSKKLGIMVWRWGKFSPHQFCTADCAYKHKEAVENVERYQKRAIERLNAYTRRHPEYTG